MGTTLTPKNDSGKAKVENKGVAKKEPLAHIVLVPPTFSSIGEQCTARTVVQQILQETVAFQSYPEM